MTTNPMPRPSDKYIPWYIVAFFVFLTVLFGWFVYIAEHTYTGVVTDEAYEKGLAYNAVIAAADAQEKMGWGSSLSYKDKRITFSLHDKQGKPVTGATVTMWFYRPVHDGKDSEVGMKEQGTGVYAAQQLPSQPGLWEIRVLAVKGEDRYQTSKRMEF